MGAVNTNSVSLAYIEEKQFGVAPSSGNAEYLEPNEISDYGADISTTARNPISKDRQNKKGTISDLSSTVSFAGDTTVSYLLAFLEGAMYSTWVKQGAWFESEISASSSDQGFNITKSTTTPLKEGTILFCRGFLNSANNGLKIVASGTTTSLIKTTDGSTLVDETAPKGASVFVVGYQGAAGSITVNAQGNLAASGFNWTDLGLSIGSAIYVGGLGASNSFTNPKNLGLARIRNIYSSLLVIDKCDQKFEEEDDSGSEKTIQIFFGWFLRNVPTDDPLFKQRTYSFELSYPGLAEDGVKDGYEYSVGNIINTFELSLPLNDKSTTSITTFGKDVDPITESRKGWTLKQPIFTEAFSTSNDFLRLRLQNVDETGLTTVFKDATLSINNNASGENILGKLGPAFVNYGNFDVSLETSAVFTNKDVTSKIRNNCTVTCDFCLINNDGAFYFDIPAMTLGDGNREFPVNEKVKIALSSSAYGDTALGYTISQTFFPYLPSDKADAC